MKKLLFISAIFVMASCTKLRVGVNCYECEFGYVNGVKPPNELYCGDMPKQFTDAQGNPLQSFCKPK